MKVKPITRVYLTVEITEPRFTKDPREWAKRGHKRCADIGRLLHAAGFDDIGEVGYEVEEPARCSLCGSEWEEDADGPLCCTAAQNEWMAAQSTPTPTRP